MLGRKQTSSHEDWLRTLATIEQRVPREHIDRLTEQTVDDVRKKTRGKRVAFAWSGGKDSLVLERIMRMAGIEDCMMGICNLEYPEFLRWVTDHMPPALEIINTGQDLRWLQRNQDMLFPQDAATAAKWFKIVQHTAQERYYQKHRLDMIILGRRRMDGNYTGKDGIYTNRKGITRYSPLRDWTHEDVLAFIHYHRIELPPIYRWPRGFRVGTGPWPARQWTGSIENGWREVYIIDPSIVEEAAEYIPSAREFLARIAR